MSSKNKRAKESSENFISYWTRLRYFKVLLNLTNTFQLNLACTFLNCNYNWEQDYKTSYLISVVHNVDS